MAEVRLECAIIGLGKMGGSLASQAVSKGIRVLGLNLGGVRRDLIEQGVEPQEDLRRLKDRLASPRIVMLYVPAGEAVDQTLTGLKTVLEPGDIVVDGGNSYWGDSLQRHESLAEQGLRFVDMGTSGGPGGALRGASFMVGAEPEVYAQLEPLLSRLSTPGGLFHAGPPGAGHFTKLVHNGIEFGMMQAIAEGRCG